MTTSIPLSFASLLILRSVLRKKNVRELITELKGCTIKISTRLNFVTAILIRNKEMSASIVTTAPLHTQWRISKSGYFTMCSSFIRKIMIFTSISSKLSGVPSTMITTKLNAFMRITSKTTGVNLIYSDMKLNSVKTGRVVPSLPAMKKVVRDCNHASIVMDGRSSSSTL
jgi:hypothetical protein